MSEARRILVVDDQRAILEMTSTLLAGAGYSIQTAANGTEALERLGRESYDLVLLDINMPGADGWEVLRLIRADRQLDELPVMIFSVKGEMRDKMVGMQEGAVDYITKPFEVDDLLARVEKIMLGASVGDATA